MGKNADFTETFKMKTIGIDIGGTWLRAALIDREGAEPKILRMPTERQRPAEHIVENLVALVTGLTIDTGVEIAGIGIGVPTTFDAEGRLDPCPNLPMMAHYPLQQVLHDRLKLPVWMQNDAQCFALGEWRFGVGKGQAISVLAGITLGTGLGLGIVIDGKPFRGAHGRAGEIWLAPADIADNAEAPRHIEALVSGTAIEDHYAQHTGLRLTAEEIASQTDRQAHARTVYESFGSSLKNVLLWVADLLDPEIIVLGGSVTRSHTHFYETVAAGMKTRKSRVVISDLGDLAALYGAAMPGNFD